MTDAERAKIIAKIQALMAKTTANGATEEEALSAMEKATLLMDRYSISFAEVHNRPEEGWDERKLNPKERWKAYFYDLISSPIGVYTGTIAIQHKMVHQRGKTVTAATYFGTASDVEFAVWLTEALGGFVFNGLEAAIVSLKHFNPRIKRGAIDKFRKSYLYGAARQIHNRLWEIIEARKAAMQQATGTQLAIISKRELAREELYRRRPGMGAASAAKTPALDPLGYSLGDRRGRDAQFNRPVAQNGPALIGRK